MGVHWKTQFLGGCMKNQYIGGELPKIWALDGLQKRVMFLKGAWDLQWKLWVGETFILTLISKAKNIVAQ